MVNDDGRLPRVFRTTSPIPNQNGMDEDLMPIHVRHCPNMYNANSYAHKERRNLSSESENGIAYGAHWKTIDAKKKIKPTLREALSLE